MRITYTELSTANFYVYPEPSTGPAGESFNYGELHREGRKPLAIRRTRHSVTKHRDLEWHAAPLPKGKPIPSTPSASFRTPVRPAEAVKPDAWRPFDPLGRWASVRIEVRQPDGKPFHFRGVVGLDDRTFLASADPMVWLQVDLRPHRRSYRSEAVKLACKHWQDSPGVNGLTDYYRESTILDSAGLPKVPAVLLDGDSIDCPGFKATIVAVASRFRLIPSNAPRPAPWN